MRRPFVLISVLCLILLPASCVADSYEEGRALYKDGKYAEAAGKLEQATREDPNSAKAWWQLNFAYHKLGRESDSLKAVQKAGELDSAHTFASDPGKYADVLGARQAAAGGGAASNRAAVPAPRSSASSRAGSGSSAITQQLLAGDVYAEPGVNVDVAQLQKVAHDLKPTPVKFVIFNSRSGSATLSREANRIRDYLSIGSGYVIAASKAGVAASSKQLNRDTLSRLTREVAPQMEAGDYTGGLERLARGLVQTKKAQVASTTNMWIIIIVIIGGGVGIWLVTKAAANARAMAARRGPLERQKADIISQMNFLDDNVALLDQAKADQVRQARIAAGTKLDEAARIMTHAKKDRDLEGASMLLDRAGADIARGRGVISGTAAPIAAAAAAGAAPATSSAETDWNAIPQQEKGVCFFCSKPELLNELTPVTVNLSGQQQKVLACSDDLATIKTGSTPQIRAFNDGGRNVPWYAYQGYDPYRDYYRGYGSGSFIGDMIMLSAIDNMFWGWHHPMGWGWGGYGNSYVFYPDHEYYHDYYSGQAAGYGDFERTQDAAGTDFLQSGGGDTGDLASGGQDFLGRDQS